MFVNLCLFFLLSLFNAQNKKKKNYSFTSNPSLYLNFINYSFVSSSSGSDFFKTSK